MRQTPLSNPDELAQLIKTCLRNYYRRRIIALDGLDLKKVLSRKNPYLFRANGISNAPEMINQLLVAHSSSSDEGIFGEEFFEPICKEVSGAQTAAAKGIDFTIETSESFEAISLKSGPNAFNSSQVSKQGDQFDELERSLRATLRSLRKTFLPIMGCGYGRVNSGPTRAKRYYKLAGQAFWERVTGDPDFYIKIMQLMEEAPEQHKVEFTEAWDRAINRFVRDFSVQFCDASGEILWEELAQFNSSSPKRRNSSDLG